MEKKEDLLLKRFRIVFQPGGSEIYTPEGITVKDAINMARIGTTSPAAGGANVENAVLRSWTVPPI